MSIFAPGAKMFLLAADGSILNVDYVVRVFESAGKVMADMATGPDIELLATAAKLDDLRHQLPLNRVVP